MPRILERGRLMPQIAITLGQDGRLQGLTKDDAAHYKRWRRRVESMKPGEVVAFSWSDPRAPEIHRRHFALLNTLFENQEVFACEREFRKWTERGARHVEVLEHGGLKFELVKSVAYDQLDGSEFVELHQRVKAYLLTHAALMHLWPHVDPCVSYEALKSLIEEVR